MAAGQEWSHTVEPPPSLLLIYDLESNNKTRRRPNYSSEGNWRKYVSLDCWRSGRGREENESGPTQQATLHTSCLPPTPPPLLQDKRPSAPLIDVKKTPEE
ncbi:unnamed protein product [Leuciscus chuanchicus]